MNNHKQGLDVMNDEIDPLETLFRGVPKRLNPSVENTQQAHAILQNDWQALALEHKKKRQRWQNLSIAAGLMLAITVGVLQWQNPEHATVQIAYANELLLDERVVSSPSVSIEPGQVLYAADDASLLLGSMSLRLAAGTELRWQGGQNGEQPQVQLTQGQIYVDAAGSPSFQVNTDFGTVTDIGTQYLVSVSDREMQASVREGSIVVDTHSSQHTAVSSPNKSVVFLVKEEGVSQFSEPAGSERWAWVHKATTAYSSKSVSQLLTAIARDLGKSLEYASPGVAASVATMQLSGQLEPAEPMETLAIITQSSNLGFSESGQIIKIRSLP